MSRNQPSTRRLGSIAEAADYYGCSPRTIRRRVADGSLRAYRLGRLIRVDLNELDSLAHHSGVGA